MAKYDFRILIDTKEGKKFSYCSASFFNSEVDTTLVLSASQVFNRISNSISCSYYNQNKLPALAESSSDLSENFASNPYISASLSGSNYGHVEFIYQGLRPVATDGTIDRLERFKFFGVKVCNSLGLKHNDWYYPQTLKVSGSTIAMRASSVDTKNLFIQNNLKMSNYASFNSDLIFKLDKEASRYVRFINASGSGGELPNDDLVIGYNDQTNTYMISASGRHAISGLQSAETPKFIIDGVTELNTISMSSTYVTSSNVITLNAITSSFISSSGHITASQIKLTDANGAIYNEGDIHMHKTDGQSSQIHFYNGGWDAGHVDAEIYLDSSEYFQMRTKNDGTNLVLSTTNFANAVYIDDSTENLGIGTITPQETLTVEGNVSASGNLVLGSTIGAKPYFSASMGNIEISGSGVAELNVSGSIWADTSISSSRLHVTGDITGSSELVIGGNITASGNISSSGDLNIQNIYLDDAFSIRNQSDNVRLRFGTPSNSSELKLLSGNLNVTSHITASGNISASGEFIGKVGTFSYGTGVESSVGDFSGEVIYDGDDSTTAGQIYYSNNGTWTHTDADAASTANGLIAVALGGNSTTNGMLLRGTVKLDHDPGGNIGVPLYLSTTAGDATSTAPLGTGDIVRVIGYNLGTSGEIYFNPDNTWVEVS